MSYLGHQWFYQFHMESVTSISKFTPKTLGKNLILAASQQLLSVFPTTWIRVGSVRQEDRSCCVFSKMSWENDTTF